MGSRLISWLIKKKSIQVKNHKIVSYIVKLFSYNKQLQCINKILTVRLTNEDFSSRTQYYFFSSQFSNQLINAVLITFGCKPNIFKIPLLTEVTYCLPLTVHIHNGLSTVDFKFCFL